MKNIGEAQVHEVLYCVYDEITGELLGGFPKLVDAEHYASTRIAG